MVRRVTGWTLGVVLLGAGCVPHYPDKPVGENVVEISTGSGLVYSIVQEGTGPHAEPGDEVLIHETTSTADGIVVVDTWAMNHPIRFTLGAKQVIDGMDQAVTGMRVGERRRLVVPPSLSRRTAYPDSFGPDDTLYYDVVLLQIFSR